MSFNSFISVCKAAIYLQWRHWCHKKWFYWYQNFPRLSWKLSKQRCLYMDTENRKFESQCLLELYRLQHPKTRAHFTLSGLFTGRHSRFKKMVEWNNILNHNKWKLSLLTLLCAIFLYDYQIKGIKKGLWT